ncbi:alpha/beta hydrolase [Thermoplasmatales archaeon AK]|nr:alpha/beta hydrolase [Thermoplasmatales archaeon AK]
MPVANISTEDGILKMAYYDLGSGFPVVLLHSFNHSKLMWLYQIPPLINEGYRVICPDFRGHGETPLLGKITMYTLARDTIALMKELGIKKAVFVGSSMGGYVILSLLRLSPDLVKGVILGGTKAHPDSDEAKERRRRQISVVQEKGVGEFVKDVHKRLSKDTAMNRPWVVDLVRTMSISTSKESIVQTLEAMINKNDDRDLLRNLEVPALIVCGVEDTFTPLEYSKFLHENIKGSKLVILEKAAHINMLDQPHKFNQEMLSFLRSVIS